MRVFLTGGTGLIGSHVVEQLRGRGDDVVALVRTTSDTTHLAALGAELVTGDVLDDPDEQARRMRGCDALVHAAARVFMGGSRRTFERENLEGTERVLEAASHMAPRVVHLSSVAVYAGLYLERVTEDVWTRADPKRQSAYAASKHLAERAAWRAHERGAIRLTTLRPSVVYGEHDRAATRVIVRYASLRAVPLLGGGETNLPLVYAGNVARAVVAALDRPAAIGRAYNVALDEPITARRLVTLVARELGRHPRFVRMPAAPARVAAAVADRVLNVLPLSVPGGFRRAVRTMVLDNAYDCARARLELGWTNLVPHEEGVRRTMAWWRRSQLASPVGRSVA